MKKNHFIGYLKSKIVLNSNHIYFCNRFDSSPFYEPTYDHNYSILDYLIDEYDVKFHAYLMYPRGLFGKKKIWPLSSNYFDLILKNYKLTFLFCSQSSLHR